MSDFSIFSKAVHDQYFQMSQHELFIVDIEKDHIWDQYLSFFPEGTNPIFRVNTEHDCSCCRNFIKNLGRVVMIKDGVICTVWSNLKGLPYPYDVVAAKMDLLVQDYPIASVFRSKESKYGHEFNYELIDDKTHVWHHFHGNVVKKHFHTSPAEAAGSLNSTVQVVTRGIVEIDPQAVQTVVDLINSNALYRGQEHLSSVLAFQKLQQKYMQKPSNVFAWEHLEMPGARIRNTAIGTLLVDLSEGMDLESAVKSFESKVAPQNYKRTTALITPAMIKNALAKLRELDLESAVERRFAKLSDVSINNVIWANSSAQQVMKDSLADSLMQSAQVRPVGNRGAVASGISIQDFMSSVVPNAAQMEIFFANTMTKNLVSLSAPVHADVNQLFQWDNNFGWSYNGNITDSIKEKVKRAGGNTDAKLRVSLAWFNGDDLDIHCHGPDGHIYFGNKWGILDVDMNAGYAHNTTDPVENLSWKTPRDGEYRIGVNQYNQRNTNNPGFVLEVENNGSVSQYSYQQIARGMIDAITFTVKKGAIVDLKVGKGLTGQGIGKETWNLKTEQFVPVSTLMFSPNYWDENQKGNKHWFFMMEGCKNDEPIRGIYNEFLTPALHEHRKVFEVLGAQTMCPVVDDQLSGLGFSSTNQDEVQIKVTSSKGDQRVYLVQF